MFGSAVLEVGIGLSFFYLLLSVMCSGVNEWIAGLLSLRGENLRHGIVNLLHDTDSSGISREIFDHPLIQGLAKPDKRFTLFGRRRRRPSYVPAKLFTSVLIDILAREGNDGSPIKDFRSDFLFFICY